MLPYVAGGRCISLIGVFISKNGNFGANQELFVSVTELLNHSCSEFRHIFRFD